VFGKLFIANPGLAERIAADVARNCWDRDTFYTSELKGYMDYPTLPG